MKVYLIGYMGSGKTTVGKKLAKILKCKFIDLDHFFEEKYDISISDFFKKYNEISFRDIEKKLIEEISQVEDLVVSTGGGTPCFFDNLEVMKSTGIVVYLQISARSLTNRLLIAKEKRPILENITNDKFFSFVKKQIKEREPYYKQADIIIQGENINMNALVGGLQKLSPM